MEAFTQFLVIIGIPLLALIFSYIRNNTRKGMTKLVPIEPSGAFPFVGHLHLLRGEAPPSRILGNIVDDYGPIYALRLGSRKAVVVSSWQMVKECFTTNDRNFAARPTMASSRLMVYNNAGFALTSNVPYWREIRKLATSELFTSQRLEMFKNVRSSEVNRFMKELSLFSLKNANKAFVTDMRGWFENVTFNITLQILAGKRFSYGSMIQGHNEEGLHVHEAIKEGVYLSGVFVVSDFFPYLEWMDIGGHVKAMKQVEKEVDGVVGKWLDEHVKERKVCDGSDYKDADFMDVMLSTLSKDAEMFGHGRETIIKATIMALMLTGSESLAFPLIWALSLLLNNPHVLKAAQKELDMNVGRTKWVEESDVKNLPYLQSIVKETLRMYPTAPLAGAHEAAEDCYIGGYHISKGTRLIVNIWKLHRDPKIWPNPDVFRPERFLEEHSDLTYQGQNFEYIPFGTGRRMCPAITFAFQIVHLTLARLLQGFDLSTPMGKPVDMSEGLGVAVPKVTPLEVIITPRLSLELYI